MHERIIESLVCPGCSCLCDDIDVALDGTEIKQINNICDWGIGRFLNGKKFAYKKERRRPDGHSVQEDRERKPIRLDEACEKSAALLKGGKRVFFYGLGQCGSKAQEIIYRMGKKIEAVFVPSEGPLLTLFLEYGRQHGISTSTLEAVRHQADVIIFWGANPLHSCPRLPTRYAFFARGRFTERGEEDRKVFVVDLRETELKKVAHSVVLRGEGDLELLRAMKLMFKGKVPEKYGAKPKQVRALVKAIDEGNYIAIFCGRGPLYSPDRGAFVQQLVELVSMLNERKDAVLLPMATDFNTCGFYQILLRSGDFDDMKERLLPDVHEWSPKNGDIVLGIGSDFLWFLNDDQKQALEKKDVSIVSISGYETLTHVRADVSISCALAGIEVSDVAYRLDALPVRLRAIKEPLFPPDWEILGKIADNL